MMPGLPDTLLAVASPSAQGLERWRVIVLICTVVFGLILAVLLFAVRRAPRGRREEPSGPASAGRPVEPGPRRGAAAGITASVLLLLALVVAGVFTDRALARLSLSEAVRIEVTAHQWWWKVRYQAPQDADAFETANEIHVPVGRPVVVRLASNDVVHSLWIPSLAGRKDLVPGRPVVMVFQADAPGLYRGQCAEFCGSQKTTMDLVVHAHPPGKYEAWLRAQLHRPPSATQAQGPRGAAGP